MVISTHGTLYKILASIESLSDDILCDIVFIMKTIVAFIMFTAVVIAWDSLPSSAPIKDVEVHYRTESRPGILLEQGSIPARYEVHLMYKYKPTKDVPYFIDYAVTNKDLDISVREHDRVNGDITHLEKSISLPAPGEWCVTTSLSWESGLSLRTRNRPLDSRCFRV